MKFIVVRNSPAVWNEASARIMLSSTEPNIINEPLPQELEAVFGLLIPPFDGKPVLVVESSDKEKFLLHLTPWWSHVTIIKQNELKLGNENKPHLIKFLEAVGSKLSFSQTGILLLATFFQHQMGTRFTGTFLLSSPTSFSTTC